MKNILVAEDNAVNRELVRELLETHGYSVFEASNGQEALQMITESIPDLLLLDLGMPVLDGFGVIRQVRDNPAWATLPVLALTAYAMQGDRDRIIGSGFHGYLSKPINSGALLKELTRLLETRDSCEQQE